MRDELVGIYQVDGVKTAVVTVDDGYRILGFGIMSVVLTKDQVVDLIESRQWVKVA